MTKPWFLNRCNEIWVAAGHATMPGHTFCIGGATELLLEGVPPDVVAVQGCWKSCAFLDYWRQIVLPWSGPEPQFKPDFWSGSPWFGPWFSRQPEPDRKTVLGSRSSLTVRFWFSLPKPFRTLVNFAFLKVKTDLRDFHYLQLGFAIS
ncbi:hypothetical protein F4604DRAFT_1932255 [Suillus subluteus]|nr:hypothetical protein F4604DRAFT_1932255 [Suillus subluteus]